MPALWGIFCTTVDMSLAAGMGSVTIKNALVSSVKPSGQFTAAQHCNGKDVWLIGHDIGNGNFRAFLITSAGVNTTPVISNMGTTGTTYSYMKVSYTGKKMASQYNSGFPTLYDFDPATGVVSNSLSLGSPYACCFRAFEFSPDGTKLYATGSINGGIPSQIFQWDLCAGSNTAIIASQYTIAATFLADGLQLAPDGKIYAARDNQTTLGVINNPNTAGAGCNYVNLGQSIAPKVCKSGLPNFMSRPRPSAAFTHSTICQAVQFTNTAATNTLVVNCAANTYSVLSWSWDFGDPLSGSSNTSTILTPTHLYTALGTYTAQLILNYTCYSDTLKQVISITVPSPTFNVTGNFTICPGNSATLTANGATTYSWSNNSTGSVVVLSPSVTTNYTVSGTGTNVCFPVVSSITVNVIPSSIALTGPSGICPGKTATLIGTGVSTYSWSNGSNSNSISVSPLSNTIYTLSGTDSSGCIRTATLSQLVYPAPSLSVSGSGTLCEGAFKQLGASGLSTYTWSTNAFTNTINVQPLVNTVYTVTGADLNGCIASTTLMVNPIALPSLSITGDSSICKGEFAELSISGASTYTWSTGDTTKTIILTPNETNIYSVTATFKNGCITTTQTPIIVKPSQNLVISADVKITPGTKITLSVSGGSNYVWTPDSMLSCATCSNPIVSPIRTTRYCVMSENYVCKKQNCVKVEVNCASADFSVPNAFSPNGDGINDEFCLQGWDFCISGFSVLIFDRWGEKVYESQNPSFCWNGVYKGKPLETDVFVFVINANFSDGIKINKKGNITLLR